jgi:hypothetical protein
MSQTFTPRHLGVVITMTALLLVGPNAARAKEAAKWSADTSDGQNEKVVSPVPAYVLFAGGGAFLLTSIITGSVALKLNSDLKDDCPGNGCYEPYHDKVDRMDNLALVTDVFLPLSIVMVVSGAFMLVWSRKTHERYAALSEKKRTDTSALERLSVTGNGVMWRF